MLTRASLAKRAAVLVTLTVMLIAAADRPASAAAAWRRDGDVPRGFWWGTDSWPVRVPRGAPYRMPFLGGAYGGYMGMVGNWAYWFDCPGQERFLAVAHSDYSRAHIDYVRYGRGIGDGAYWFLGGPGVDPHWNGTRQEARAWGRRQAERALADVSHHHIDYPVVWMDIELPGDTPAPDNGWNSVYTSTCSGVTRRSYIPPAVDRADFNGFWDYVTHHSQYAPGVYSSPEVWRAIFGTGRASEIPHTDEWTYEPETRDYTGDHPHGWCLPSGGCARFFGRVSRFGRHALMWQWSGGGGATNGIDGFNGDLDQIDRNRQNPDPPPGGSS